MHPVIVENLEEYLAGALLPAAHREFEAHLRACPACREEVQGMQEVSTWFVALRPGEPVSPPVGFVARVMDEVAARRIPSFWSIFFAIDPGFGRRVVFASLLALAVLGSYLVSRESGYAPVPPSPESIMAIEQTPPGGARMSDRDMMLVTLTSYEP